MGVIRMILLIIGALVVLRFLGQLMNAKRNIEEEKQIKASQDAINKARKHVEKNKGKIRIIPKSKRENTPFEDVDFEEVKD
jgi:hypothetical protein